MIAAACVLYNFLIDHNEINYESNEELLKQKQEEVAVEKK